MSPQHYRNGPIDTFTGKTTKNPEFEPIVLTKARKATLRANLLR